MLLVGFGLEGDCLIFPSYQGQGTWTKISVYCVLFNRNFPNNKIHHTISSTSTDHPSTHARYVVLFLVFLVAGVSASAVARPCLQVELTGSHWKHDPPFSDRKYIMIEDSQGYTTNAWCWIYSYLSNSNGYIYMMVSVCICFGGLIFYAVA